MFSVEHLNHLREYELDFIARFLRPGARVLEIGGGTGAQAKALTDRGYDVVSVDVPASNYAEQRCFPIIEYDGTRLPFSDGSFDIVFSSNVLEHIKELDIVLDEFDRVLVEDGYSVHVMPTGSWRLWTNVANYVELLQRLGQLAPSLFPRGVRPAEFRRLAGVLKNMLKLGAVYVVPPRHGEFGNAFTEIWTFSKRSWLRYFKARGRDVDAAQPMNLFYTGHMVFGASWSMERRSGLSRTLGSACVLYRLPKRGGGGRK